MICLQIDREEEEKEVPQMGKQQKPKGASWHDLEGEELKDHPLLNITQVSEVHMACWDMSSLTGAYITSPGLSIKSSSCLNFRIRNKTKEAEGCLGNKRRI